MTADVDVVADLRLKDVELFASALQGDFYFDLDTIRESVSRRASFSVIHLRTMFRVDVFPAKDRPFDHVQMERRQRVAITSEPDRIASVATAEDNILAKLESYRLGNEASERQWTDVLNVLRTQSGRLDIDHLRKWAEVLGVADLLTRALDEVRLK